MHHEEKDISTGENGANEDYTIGEKFCGVEDVNNSDESVLFRMEGDTKATYYPNVQGKYASL